MPDPRIARMAETIAGFCTPIEKGDLVAIYSTPLAEELLIALVRQIVERGGIPTLQLAPSGYGETLLKYATPEVLERINPVDEFLVENAQVRLRILADANTRALSGIDPARQGMLSKAARPISLRFMERQSTGELDWCVAPYPTEAFAQDAEMSLADYQEFVFEACFLNDANPANRWRELSANQQRLVDWLAGKETIRVLADDTDLTLSVKGRKFINADGHKNFPDGEFFTGPVEDSVNGHIRYTFPAIFNGREVEDIRLWFEEGKVVKATAGRNQAFLEEMLNMDDGARRLGEFAIGNNFGIQKFTRNILFDEKIGGTVHLALGSSYPDTGGVNQSALHWDMICDLRDRENGGTGDGGEVWVDGTLFAKGGRFVV